MSVSVYNDKPIKNFYSIQSQHLFSIHDDDHPQLQKHFAIIKDFIDQKKITLATREVDRMWRHYPEKSIAIAPLYSQLLHYEGKHPEALIRMIERCSPHPDLEAFAVNALFQLGHKKECINRLNKALTQFLLQKGDLLHDIAEYIFNDRNTSLDGWIAKDAKLNIIGQIKQSVETIVALSSNQTPLPQSQIRRIRNVIIDDFTIRIKKTQSISQIQFITNGKTITQDIYQLNNSYQVDGRSDVIRGKITGWVRLGSIPNLNPSLLISDEANNKVCIKPSTSKLSEFRWPYTLDIKSSGLSGHVFKIYALMPNGSLKEIPDSPLFLATGIKLPSKYRFKTTHWPPITPSCINQNTPEPASKTIDIVIPIFGARIQSLACINSVLSTTKKLTNIIANLIVIDDGSIDKELSESLEQLAKLKLITLITHKKNQGFVLTANQGMSSNPDRDVILLNSDTIVFSDWLTRIQMAAYSEAFIGTVTPLSNDGSIVHYTYSPNYEKDIDAAEKIDHLTSLINSGITTEIPVGVGFCLYIRRDCLKDVGLFDDKTFGLGYGEETDFCLRARARGWSHILAADTYIYHAGGQSFGEKRSALLARSQRLISLRHPGFNKFVTNFINCDPLRPIRQRLDEHRLIEEKAKIVLIITLALPGGVDKFVFNRCKTLSNQGFTPLILMPTKELSTRLFELKTHSDLLLNPLIYQLPEEIDYFTNIINQLDIKFIEIHHFLNIDPKLIHLITQLPPHYDVYLHDYAWICPRITLINKNKRYCGEPSIDQCELCASEDSTAIDEHISVSALRERSSLLLRKARSVIAPSLDTATRYERHISGLAVQINPYGIPPISSTIPRQIAPSKIIKVALIGAIGIHKGSGILLECCQDAAKRKLPIEFVVIGFVRAEEESALLRTQKVSITGVYAEEEVQHLINRENPHLVLMPSVWPETWCYALDHAIKSNLHIISFDIGAIAERLRQSHHVYTLIPINTQAQEINNIILEQTQ